MLTSYIKYVRYAAALLSLHCSPPVSYRRSIDIYVANKSPFKHGSYKAQYEIRVNQEALYLWNVTGTTADVFLEYIQRNLAAGLGMNVQLQAMEPLPKSIISHMERDPGLDTQNSCNWLRRKKVVEHGGREQDVCVARYCRQ